MRTKIKITSFQRQSLEQHEHQNNKINTQISINFIVFTPHKKLGFAQKIIKDKQKQRNDIGFTKCIQISGLNYAIQSSPSGVPVFCIFDKELDEQIIKTFLTNKKAVENKQLFSMAIFIEKLEELSNQYYHNQGINMITCKQEKICQYIDKALNIRKGLSSEISSSSLNSNDYQEIHKRFEDQKTMSQALIPDSERNQQEEPMYGEQSPGYKYNKVDDFSHSSGGKKFGKDTKAANPQQWQNTKKTFSRMEG